MKKNIAFFQRGVNLNSAPVAQLVAHDASTAYIMGPNPREHTNWQKYIPSMHCKLLCKSLSVCQIHECEMSEGKER